MYICDDLLYKELIINFEQVVNLSQTVYYEIKDQKDYTQYYETVYVIFDDLLLIAKITSMLHPVAFHCWNGAENIIEHFNKTFRENDNPKPYLLNFVYNFGVIFDSFREVVLFFMEDPRGLANNVHDAGYNFGLAIYFLITPESAQYKSVAIPGHKTDYDNLSEEERKKWHG